MRSPGVSASNGISPATGAPTFTDLLGTPTFRAMAASTAVAGVGNGVFAALSFLYLTRMVALSAPSAGAALTVAGVAALLVGAPAGRMLDRASLVGTNAVFLFAQAAGVVALAVTRAHVPILLAAGGVALASKLKLAARGALIAVAFTGPQRQLARAWFRTLSNAGIALGSGLAVIVTALDRVQAYHVALLAVAGVYVVAAGLLYWMRGSVPRGRASVAAAPARRYGALRDRRYLVFAVLNGILSVHYLLVEVGVPVWTQHRVPHLAWLVSAGLILNTLVVVGGQVPVSHRIVGVDAAIRAQSHAGLAFALATAGMFAAASLPSVWGIAIALVSIGVYSLGEIMQAAAAWELSFELADAQRPGEYQGVFASSANIGPILAPFLISWLLTALGNAGWLVLGAGLYGVAAAHVVLRALERPVLYVTQNTADAGEDRAPARLTP